MGDRGGDSWGEGGNWGGDVMGRDILELGLFRVEIDGDIGRWVFGVVGYHRYEFPLIISKYPNNRQFHYPSITIHQIPQLTIYLYLPSLLPSSQKKNKVESQCYINHSSSSPNTRRFFGTMFSLK
jgi:hypothetical protein